MDTRLLQEAILDGGIRSVNFFNGRLLTGRDLSREQAARRDADRRVAQAAGEGVAYGLEVSLSADAKPLTPTVTVQPGLAVSRSGRTLYLESATDVTLGRRALPRVPASRTFDDCGGLRGTYAARPGIYLLTIAPAEDREGRALTGALDDAAVPCNTDATVEGVQFRLLSLDGALDQGTLVDRLLTRNRIAYRCFGVDGMLAFRCDPLGTGDDDHALLAGLDPSVLTDCDVPLAVVSLEVEIDYVDMWAVRRRLTRRTPAGPWAALCGDRRRAEGEAMFLQFEEQLRGLAATRKDLSEIEARAHFEYLPAAGIIPMPPERDRHEALLKRFFHGLTVRGPAFIEGARLEPLIRGSFAFAPIDVPSRELIWLYWVRENRQAMNRLPQPPQAFLVFTSGHMPYQGDARFDAARWDYANFALD